MSNVERRQSGRNRSTVRILIRVIVSLALGLAALFVWNGTEDSWKAGEQGRGPVEPALPGSELRVLALNLAKASFHRGGTDFAPTEEVERRLQAVGALCREHRVDLLFASEIVLESGPAPLNQVEHLAHAGGFAAWTYGDNYSFGVPGLRIRSGNAILSRYPLSAPRVVALPGDAPFWNPTNRRRLLFSTLHLGEERIPVGSVRNDSFDLENNARQVEWILAELPPGPVLLGGDFNAGPEDRSFELLRASQRFAGVFDGQPTYPAHRPTRRIDTVLVPLGWEILSEEVLDVDLSDHEPVLVRLRR